MSGDRDRDTAPPCVADAVWGVDRITVAGKTIGLANLSRMIAEVRAMNLAAPAEIRGELMKRVREENYIPPGLADAYADAVCAKYRGSGRRPG